MSSHLPDFYILLVDETTAGRLTRTVEVLKALAHPARLRILAMLATGELCVCQMTAVLELAVSTVSAHLTELRRAGLVTEAKDGRFVSYRLARGRDTDALLRLVQSFAAGDPRIRSDAELVGRLRAVGAEELCRVEMDLSKLGLQRAARR